MRNITANLGGGKVRREVLNGRNYVVVPVTMAKPGVMHGNKGPLLYPGRELARNPEDWNAIPIVLSHPKVNGAHVSARQPAVFDSYGLGHVYNAGYRGKLSAEAWLDEELTSARAPDFYRGVLNGDKFDVSTGLFTVDVVQPGVYEGTPYDAVATNYRPDHLAVLLDEPAACGVAGGCGINVNAKVSHDEIRAKLQALVDKNFGVPYPEMNDDGEYEPEDPAEMMKKCEPHQSFYPYVVDVFDRDFIYSAQGGLWRVGYSVDNRTGEVSLADGKPEKVERVTTYKAAPADAADAADTPHVHSDGTNATDRQTTQPVPVKEPQPMSMTPEQKAALVGHLTTNCKCWQGEEKTLNAMSDDKLAALKADADELARLRTTQATTPPAQATVNAAPPPVAAAQTVPVAQPAAQLTEAEWLASAPPAVRSAVMNSMAIEQRERRQIVERLVANSAEAERAAHRERLTAKPLAELQFLDTLIPKAAPAREFDDLDRLGAVPNYTGAAPAVNAGGRDEEPDLLPAFYEDEAA